MMVRIKERFDVLRRMGLGLVAVLMVMTVAGFAHAAQETFATPESAVEAFVAAHKPGNTAALLKILGPDSEKLINSGDPVADKEGREKFMKAFDAAHKIESEGENRRILVVGEEEWPFPIPLVRSGEAWRFDTEAGEQEILNRRIGRNELNVMQVCRSYVEAQREFAKLTPKAAGKPEYAKRFLSAPGNHDGLYWPTKPDEAESPLGPLLAAAGAEGYNNKATETRLPYHGYFYKILTQQGKDASGGAANYIINGKMTGGFALIAYPARYGDSGVMTFIINQNGIVYEKNLGPKTAEIAKQITVYDPDKSWKIP
jgi:hypothetical protein